jgi:hypothetical protein
MMSSATSTSTSTGAPGELGQAGSATDADAALRPWQFFLLAGMLCATAVVIVATGQSAASIIVLSLTVVAASLVALGAHRALVPLVLPAGVLEASTLIAGRSRAGLEREKTLVLRTIKELDFDFAMGKIARSDYDEMGGRLRARAIGLIRQLDAGGYKGAIEQELQARMGTGRTKVPPSTLDDTTFVAPISEGVTSVAPNSEGVTLVASPTLAGGTKVPPSTAATACVSCAGFNDPDARFCKHCGSKLSV